MNSENLYVIKRYRIDYACDNSRSTSHVDCEEDKIVHALTQDEVFRKVDGWNAENRNAWVSDKIANLLRIETDVENIQARIDFAVDMSVEDRDLMFGPKHIDQLFLNQRVNDKALIEAQKAVYAASEIQVWDEHSCPEFGSYYLFYPFHEQYEVQAIEDVDR